MFSKKLRIFTGISEKLRANKKLRISTGILLYVGSWLFFAIEVIIGNLPFNPFNIRTLPLEVTMAHAIAVGAVVGIGTWLGARVLKLKP